MWYTNCQWCENVIKLENAKNLVILKPENHNLSRKTAIKIEFDFNRKKKHSFIADNKLQVDQVKER